VALTESIAASLDHLVAHTLEQLDGRFGLAPKPVPAAFSRRDGQWAGQPLVLETDLRLAGGPLAQLQLARISSPEDPDLVASLTVAAIPRCETGCPVFGADLISFKGSYSLVALDLTAVGRAPSADTRARLEAARAPLRRVGRPREPGPPFGDDAVFVTPPKDERDLPVAAYLTYLDAFCRELAAPRPDVHVDLVRAAQDRYFRAMSTHMKELPVLGKFFGPEWVADYFDDVFFDRLSIR